MDPRFVGAGFAAPWRFLAILHMIQVIWGKLSMDVDPSAIVVSSVIVEPYLMVNTEYNNVTHEPNEQYIGYIADLVQKLSQVMTFNYVIKPVADGSFGYARNDGSWDGVIGEIVNGGADMGAAPIYVTPQRSEVVEFTEPFMAVYATMLFRKSPFAVKPSSSVSQPWQSGSLFPEITSFKDLVSQSKVHYGTLNKGVLVNAFKRSNVSLYRHAWKQMLKFIPPVFTRTNEEGIERLRKGENYAYIVPHTIGEYVSKREPCDLVAVSRFLLHSGYALAVAKESALKWRLDAGLRFLSETGYMDSLYRKWWSGRNECDRRVQNYRRSQKNRAVPVEKTTVYVRSSESHVADINRVTIVTLMWFAWLVTC